MKSATALTRLEASGVRTTTARKAIIEALARARHPLSADDIHQSLVAKRINKVTVYRTLETLVQSRVVRRVDVRADSMLYELQDEHDHHHIVCTSCGTIEDFDGCTAESLAKEALKGSKKFATITDHSFELFGTCTTCSS